MLKIYLIMVAGMYMAVAMAFGLDFVVEHLDAGWAPDAIVEYSLLWPLRLIPGLF